VLYRSSREGDGIYIVGAEGAASALRVTEAPAGTVHTPYDVTPDGRQVLFTAFRTDRDQGTGMAPIDSRGAITWLVDGPFAELRPRLSPDGRWMAYQSDETGRFEIYVRPFPQVMSARWQISTGGGVSPVWGRDGRELFYYQNGAILRVPFGGGTAARAGTPVRVLRVDLPGDRLGPTFDVSPDGKRFLIVKPEDGGGAIGPLMLVEHWTLPVDR
jgi:Tol biopolymer transport system component